MANVWVLAPMHPGKLLGWESWPIGHEPEGSGQTFLAGEILVMSGGRIIAASDEPNSGIVGVSMAPASGVQGTDVPFIRPLVGVWFEITLDDTTSPGHILVQADLEAAYNLTVSNHKWFLDAGETDAAAMRIKAFVDAVGGQKAGVGDTLARVYGEFIPTSTTSITI